MGYPRYLENFFNRVKLVISHYGISHNNDITYLDSDRYILTSSFGDIFIYLDPQMMYGNIQFDKLFRSVDNLIEPKDFLLNFPSLKKQFECFSKDKEIFNAVVTDDFIDSYDRRIYGYLLDMLDVSLVLEVSADDKDIDVGSFIIRYNKPMMWTKIRMLDKTDTMPFEKIYDFYYIDGSLVLDGDYKRLYQSIMSAYDLNELDAKSICFKDLAQLTLMNVY